jgi:hypothetical protein
MATYTSGSFSTTQQAQAKLVWNAGNYSGVCIFMDTAGNGACFYPNLNAVYGLTNGSGTGALVPGCAAFPSGDTVKIQGTPSATTVTDVTTSTVLCTGEPIPTATGIPGIVVDQQSASGDEITNFEAQ